MSSILSKVKVSFGSLFIIVLGAMIFNYQGSNSILKNITQIQSSHRSLTLASQFSLLATELNLGYMDAIIDRESLTIDEDIIENHNKFYQWLNQIKDEYRNALNNKELEEEFNKTLNELSVLKSTAESMFESIRKGAPEEEFAKYDDVLDGTVDRLLERNRKARNKFDGEYLNSVQDTVSISNQSKNAQVITVVVIFIIGLLMIILLSKSLKKSLSEIILKITNSLNELKNQSIVMSDNSKSLQAAATEQSSFLQETSSSAEEIGRMLSKNSDGIQTTVDYSERVNRESNIGIQKVEQMINSLNSMVATNQEVIREMNQNAESIVGIIELISDIEKKTDIINDIVFQTKLLAFNASVEAARAGEQGKGFSVVAEEVGNLANISGEAAGGIQKVLADSLKEVTEIAERSKQRVTSLQDDSQKKMNAGSDSAKECENSFNEISSQIKDMVETLREVATSSEEQNTGVAEIFQSLRHLEEITNQNTSSSVTVNDISQQVLSEVNSVQNILTELYTIAGIEPNKR